jgi:hypothetical protein
MRTPWYKSKTLWVAIAEIIVGAIYGGIQTYQGSDDLRAAIILVISGVLQGALRLITTTPIGKLPTNRG